MQGLMQHRQLLISTILEHAAQVHGDVEVISRRADRSIVRFTYADIANRSKRLANALHRFGLQPGDRVGTLAWNTHRHLELYYGVSGAGFINHTINPRLFFDQICYIVNHAADRVVFFDLSFADIVARLAPVCPSVNCWVALCEPSELPHISGVANVVSYEALIGIETDRYTWPDLDENTASSLCYTSGSTGDPKGVLYSHRSTVLHSYAAAMRDTFGIGARDVVLPASSMYHANAWGVPYAATMAGSKLVLPGAALDGASLVDLIEAEGVTVSFGVPTIWLGVLEHLEKSGRALHSLERLVVGGASCPAALMNAFRERHGVEINHLWGMTETSPLGTVNYLLEKHERLTRDLKDWQRAKQGRPVYGVQLKIVGEDGSDLPHDGKSTGDLLVRGWWVSSNYYGRDEPVLTPDGWFHTGDVASIDPGGYVRLTDRSKDVIKSGGEWISSIDLENAAVGHPAVAEAAVIGVPHPKWNERPLLILKLKDGERVSREDMLSFLSDKVVKWWLPDDVIVVNDIPHTATGKVLKTKLRETFRDHRLPGSSEHSQFVLGE